MSTDKFIIFSDLDGTLLDHFTYESSAAQATLAKLKLANIPVILNTSKTKAEVEVIAKQLQLNCPFIVENGAAVYIPEGTFTVQPTDTNLVDGYWRKEFALDRTHWLNLLDKHSATFSEMFTSFSTMTVDEVSALTNLSAENATLAKQRQYGEPIKWLGDEKSKKAFIKLLEQHGASIVHGGRFMHLCGHSDKGQALTWLAQQYQQANTKSTISTIALGDGENDSTMLEAATVAVQIRSPVHQFPELNRQEQVIQTQGFGPVGWAQALEQLLSQQFKLIA